MRYLFFVCLMCGIWPQLARGKSAIPCIEKNTNGRWVVNARRVCIQYTEEEEKWTQKNLTMLLDYITRKEPAWHANEKKYIHIVASWEESKKNWLLQVKQYERMMQSKDREADTWKQAFLALKKERVPPKQRFWENPWFWTTTGLLVVTGVVMGVIIYDRFSTKQTNLSSRPLLFGSAAVPLRNPAFSVHGSTTLLMQ